jgi:hypothetical protein
MGRESGVWTLDVDPDNGGDDALAKLLAEHGELPATRSHRTGSGGTHYLFTYPDDFEVPNTAGKLGPGLDTKGEGGCIVAPPSVSAKGAYEVIDGRDPVPAPPWLLDMVCSSIVPKATLALAPNGKATPEAVFAPLSPVPPPLFLRPAGQGERHGVARDLAWMYRQRGLCQEEATALLRVWFTARVAQPAGQPYDWSDVEACVRTAYEKPLTEAPLGSGDPRGAAEEASLAELLGALSRAQLCELPVPEPLIENVLDRRTLALLAGYWGTLKSFTALDWACSIAAGRKWQGRAAATEPGTPVLYIAAEGAHGLAQRVAAWEAGWRADAGSLVVIPRAVNLLDPGERGLICAYTAELRPALTVFDTLARCMVGGDENSAKDMGLAIRALDMVRTATVDGTVLGLHHTGKDKATVRGSSALEAACDTIYLAEGSAELISLTRTKRKDGPLADIHTLRLLSWGESGVLENVRDTPGTFGHRETVAEDVLRDVFGTIGASRAEWRDACVDNGLSRTQAYEAIKMLVSRGRVVVSGSDARPYYRPVEEAANP